MTSIHKIFSVILCICITQIRSNSVKKVFKPTKEVVINIQGYSPQQNDDYVAVSYKALPGYIVLFEPIANADRVHHMILFGCKVPFKKAKFWRGMSTCGIGEMHILYAWARNAPSFKLPDDVGFAIGNNNDSVQYLVLQIHYAYPFKGNVYDFSGLKLHLIEKRPKYLANVYLFSSSEPIPPHQSAFLNYVSCIYDYDIDIYPFAFRTHTHAMGRVVSAYVKHKNLTFGMEEWTKIGKRNPLWPQLFEIIDNNNLVIRKGDFLVAMCRFDSMDKDDWIPMGSMGTDEMCNFYMMYYRRAEDPDPFKYNAICGMNENPSFVNAQYPKEGISLLENHPEWEIDGHQNLINFGVEEKGQFNKIDDIHLGQITGLAFNNNNELVIFHRADRIWDSSTFDENNILRNKTSIKKPTILVANFDAISNFMKLINSYGESTFYMPHGIVIDENNYLYTTDVGSHQVVKWEIKNGTLSSVWKLGEKFVPGNDIKHFCKPSSVAVSKIDNSIFVADGYCNSRIVKFSKEGKYIMQWGQPTYQINFGYEYFENEKLGYFFLPHDITIDDSKRHVLVADRKNGRVQVFTEKGDSLYEIKNSNYFKTVYSISFCKDNGVFLIPGYSSDLPYNYKLNVYVASFNSNQIEFSFRPTSNDFKQPHIIRVNNNVIYVGEIENYNGKLWRFEILQGMRPKSYKTLSNVTQNFLKIVKNKKKHKGYYRQLIFFAISIIVMFCALCYYCFCLNKKNFSFWNVIFCCQKNIDRKGFQLLRNLDDYDEDKSDCDDENVFEQKTLSNNDK